MINDRRLIEDFLPIQAISAEASREKSIRKGHISTLHLWWARRPLVACRAAVYGALVPASRFVPENGPDNKKQSLGRANAAKFVERLCKYPGNPDVIKEAQRHILEAHAERLTTEISDWRSGKSPCPAWVEEFKFTGEKVTAEDIEASRAPRPRVLDPFAGGGSIPLEALRLGCEAYAMDLNPVAHIIELCTLVYPQKYGKPELNARGMTGSKNEKGETTWGGLANEVRYWGEWVLEKVRVEIGDLYPPIPDPEYQNTKDGGSGFQPVQQELTQTRRNLPHWQMGGSTYFVTFRTKSVELNAETREIVLKACLHFDGSRYNLWSAVVMPDHVHLLLQPKETEQGGWHSLSSILHSIKSFTANKINSLVGRKGTLWQDESFDRIVRDENEFLEKWNYIRNNPTKRGLVKSPDEWIGFYECTGKMPVLPDSSLESIPPGYLVPVAYLWTRTVRCKNPACGATVPLVKQTWLCKKKNRYVALKMIAPFGKKKARFEVVKSTTENGLGFDPTAFSKAGNATCPFCGTVADSGYVKSEGLTNRLGHQLSAIACRRWGAKEFIYISENDLNNALPNEKRINDRLDVLLTLFGDLNEPIITDAKNALFCVLYGISKWRDIFTNRQKLYLFTMVENVKKAEVALRKIGIETEYSKATLAYLGILVDRNVMMSCTVARWRGDKAGRVEGAFGMQTLPMVWDYAEMNPFGGLSNDAFGYFNGLVYVIANVDFKKDAVVQRGSAMNLPFQNESIDSVVTDPPYYDNVPYADLSDFFYIWLKRTIGHLFPEHFGTGGSPKKNEAVADAIRYNKDKNKARDAYERMMEKSFSEASRVLKSNGEIIVVYAHKTTLGWSTLVNALRRAAFMVTEAWPLDTEMKSRMRGMESSSLASSIFLVGRKQEGNSIGSYEEEVRPELDEIVRERVDTLWKMGITGADLVIAAVGAGLRAFTRFSRVEYANGEEVPAEKFLAEVEGVVLETMLEKIFGLTGSSVSAVDGPSRFYVLWRYTYKAAEMDAGEAIVFTYGQGVELDGQLGLSAQRPEPLVEKKKGKYRLRDFTERGDNEKLGLPKDDGRPAPLIDSLHRILWLMENEPRSLNKFLDEVRPDRERLRLIAQTLAGTALAGVKVSDLAPSPAMITTPAEQAALRKLVANWRTLIDQRLAAEEGTLFDTRRL